MRILKVDLNLVLDLIGCGEDYGFDNSILLEAFAEMMDYKLSDEEIEECSSCFLSEEAKKQGYSREDYETSKTKLTHFRKQYCKVE